MAGASSPLNPSQEQTHHRLRGELIDHKESLKRETAILENGCIWCFTVNRRWVRDANVGGNLARFINHACRAELLQPHSRQDNLDRAARNIERR
jgi:SET domain-containing protein